MCKLFATVGIPYSKTNDYKIQKILANHQDDGLGHTHMTYSPDSKEVSLATFKAFDSDYDYWFTADNYYELKFKK